MTMEPQATAASATTRALQWGLVGVLLFWSLLVRGWFASADPTHRRVFDERFNVRNAALIVESGSFMPDNGFHPSLSYLVALAPLAVSDLYSERTGDGRFAVVMEGGGTKINPGKPADGLDFTPNGYRLSRWVSCLIGVISIFVTFAIARHVYDFRVGIIAALVLSMMPWHIRQSGVFKPDILLVATAVIVFWFSMRAMEEKDWMHFAFAGAAIGAALSTKFNAAPVVLPLVIAVLVSLRRDRSLFGKLALAGVVSIAVFVLLNPYVITDFWLYRHDFSATLRDYGRKAEAGNMNALKTVLEPFRWITHEVYHGRLFGSVAVLGLVLQVRSAFQRGGSDRQRMHHVLLAAFVVGYVALYSIGSQNPEGFHNWLILMPFTAIAGAMVVWRVVDWTGSRVGSRLLRDVVAIVLVSVIVAPTTVAAHRFTYESVVPTTAKLAADFLKSRLRDPTQRLVIQEEGLTSILARWQRLRRPVVARTTRLSDLSERELDLADAEIFLASSLRGPNAEFYRRRMASYQGAVLELERGWFKAWGEDLVVVAHGWRRVGRPADIVLEATEKGVFSGTVTSPGKRRAFVSAEVWLDPAVDPAVAFQVGGSKIGLTETRKLRGNVLYLSQRFRLSANRQRSVQVTTSTGADSADEALALRLHYWRREHLKR